MIRSHYSQPINHHCFTGQVRKTSSGEITALAINCHAGKPVGSHGPRAVGGAKNLSKMFARVSNRVCQLLPEVYRCASRGTCVSSNAHHFVDALALDASPQRADGRMRDDCLFPVLDDDDNRTEGERAKVRLSAYSAVPSVFCNTVPVGGCRPVQRRVRGG